MTKKRKILIAFTKEQLVEHDNNITVNTIQTGNSKTIKLLLLLTKILAKQQKPKQHYNMHTKHIKAKAKMYYYGHSWSCLCL